MPWCYPHFRLLDHFFDFFVMFDPLVSIFVVVFIDVDLTLVFQSVCECYGLLFTVTVKNFLKVPETRFLEITLFQVFLPSAVIVCAQGFFKRLIAAAISCVLVSGLLDSSLVADVVLDGVGYVSIAAVSVHRVFSRGFDYTET